VQPPTVISNCVRNAKAIYYVSQRDLRKRGTLPDVTCEAVNPCSQAGENGSAAACRGEAAFANGCTVAQKEQQNSTLLTV
jgi:hypothetical protein